jgi:hypothetical protein
MNRTDEDEEGLPRLVVIGGSLEPGHVDTAAVISSWTDESKAPTFKSPVLDMVKKSANELWSAGIDPSVNKSDGRWQSNFTFGGDAFDA